MERTSEDRRYLTVRLTGKGEALIVTVFADVETAIITEMSALAADEQEILGRLCKKLGLRKGG
jgi:MarR family 2-MHQ and catechol resistance regulon transcriptional repressor